MLCAVNPTPSFVFNWSWMPPTRLSLCLFSLVASCQQDHRASLGKVDQGGSEVQIAGFQHCRLGSNVLFLGEGVVEVAAAEDEGIWGCESKDKRLGRRGQNSGMSLCLGFCRGQWKSSLFLSQPALTIVEKAFLAGWSVSVVSASMRQGFSFSVGLQPGGSPGQCGFALQVDQSSSVASHTTTNGVGFKAEVQVGWV